MFSFSGYFRRLNSFGNAAPAETAAWMAAAAAEKITVAGCTARQRKSTPHITSKAYAAIKKKSRIPTCGNKPGGKSLNFLIEVSSVMTRTSRLRYDKSPPANSKRRAGARPTIPSTLRSWNEPASATPPDQTFWSWMTVRCAGRSSLRPPGVLYAVL